ncbi:MAG TPA: serine/threonine-protein kinase [Polyangiaceae bacterium]|nr:serine/threonine-protein kinase [Polyangiaceae bacterium]
MFASSAASPQRRYRLIAEIGRGGMAEVYLGVAQGPGGFNKLVVVKKSLQDLALQPDILSMFLDEARLAARMNHPNVVQTYEFGEEDGRQFIAMEYLDGQPYSRVLTRLRGGRAGGVEAMSLGHHLRVLMDTLAGLHHAHELKDFDGTPLHVVHRDATPQNVFVTYDGSIKVVDFGIAKAQDSSSRTVTGEIKGKVTYMSPEQVRGEPLDRRADIFAVGVMLWEAVAGRRMWRDLPDVTVVHELLQVRIPSIRAVVPHVPAELARIIDRALAPDREDRYPSALAMQRELDAFAVASGMRVDGPEVGRVVSELFEEERRRVRTLVEAQLGSLRWTGETPSAASLPLIPTAANAITGREWVGPGDRRLEPRGLEAAIPTNSGSAVSMPAEKQSPRRSALLAAAAGLTLAVVLGGVLVVKLVKSSDRTAASGHAAASDAAAASAAPTASSDAEAASVTLKVRTSVPDAKIYLDDVLLGAGSFDGKVPRSDARHVLRVEAEGHEPKEETISLGSDLMTSFALEKVDASASSAAASAKPLPTPPGFPQGRPRPQPTGRGIDSESPYKVP